MVSTSESAANRDTKPLRGRIIVYYDNLNCKNMFNVDFLMIYLLGGMGVP